MVPGGEIMLGKHQTFLFKLERVHKDTSPMAVLSASESMTALFFKENGDWRQSRDHLKRWTKEMKTPGKGLGRED